MHALQGSNSRTFAAIVLALSAALSSALAVAALFSEDLAGMERLVPTTMGALEASDGLSPPQDLSLTVRRLAH